MPRSWSGKRSNDFARIQHIWHQSNLIRADSWAVNSSLASRPCASTALLCINLLQFLLLHLHLLLTAAATLPVQQCPVPSACCRMQQPWPWVLHAHDAYQSLTGSAYLPVSSSRRLQVRTKRFSTSSSSSIGSLSGSWRWKGSSGPSSILCGVLVLVPWISLVLLTVLLWRAKPETGRCCCWRWKVRCRGSQPAHPLAQILSSYKDCTAVCRCQAHTVCLCPHSSCRDVNTRVAQLTIPRNWQQQVFFHAGRNNKSTPRTTGKQSLTKQLQCLRLHSTRLSWVRQLQLMRGFSSMLCCGLQNTDGVLPPVHGATQRSALSCCSSCCTFWRRGRA